MKGILIERNFTQFVVFAEDTILSALSKITANQSRLIFVVSESGILQGVLTDGDFRRWIARCGDIDLNRPVTAAMNPNCRSAKEGTPPADLAGLLNTRIAAEALAELAGQIVAQGRVQRATEQHRRALVAFPGQSAASASEGLNLILVLNKNADGAGVVQQVRAEQVHQAQRDVGRLDRQWTLLQWGPRGADGETALSPPFQLVRQKVAGQRTAIVITDEQDCHRSLSQRDSQPKPTNPSRKRRRMLRV